MKRTSNLNNISSPVIPAKAGIQLLPHLLWVKKLLLSVLLLSTTLTSNAVELITYYHNDLNGSPIAASDESGNLLWREEYKPYGERLLLEEEAGDNHQWYTGKSHDDDTGLTYMGARYYDPVVGRFMATDPVGFIEDNPTSFNRYAYANNNPYKYVDPDGRYADLAIEIPSLALGVHSFSQNYQAGNYGSALVDGIGLIADVILAAIPGAPGGVGLGIKAVREGTELAAKGAGKAASKSDDVIHVTKDGVALPPGPKHKIPDNYVQNPHRSGNYGEIVNGKFKERLRIDPPTPPGQKGPNYSHYHKNGKGTHYSPRPGDKDPGF